MNKMSPSVEVSTSLENNNNEKEKMKENTEVSRSSGIESSSIYRKCFVCSKKVMIHSKCKCLNYFCGKHLHQHDCSYSHFQNHKSFLEKKSIKIESDKVIRL